jgi:chromosome segregation ATPase
VKLSSEIEELRAELASVAMGIARLLSGERYDEAELAELDVRKRELRAKINKIEAPARIARANAACIWPR